MRFIVAFVLLICTSMLLVSCETSTKHKLGILRKAPDSTKVQTRPKLHIPGHVQGAQQGAIQPTSDEPATDQVDSNKMETQ